MTRVQLQALVEDAQSLLQLQDKYLFEQNSSERCIAARLAYHLQLLLPGWSVDVEYDRVGEAREPKQLAWTLRVLIVAPFSAVLTWCRI